MGIRLSMISQILFCSRMTPKMGHSFSSSSASFPKALKFDDTAPQNRVVIIGAGLAGSATALALLRRGIPCRIYEKDPYESYRKQGYALTLQQGMRAMEWMGIKKEELLEGGIVSTRHVSFHARTGEILGNYGPKEGKVSKGKHNIHLPRQALRRLILQRAIELDPTVVQFDYSISSISEKIQLVGNANIGAKRGDLRNVITLEFERNQNQNKNEEVVKEEISCGLLVGCDGIYSKTRSLMTTTSATNSNCIDSHSNGAFRSILSRDIDEGGKLRHLGLSVILGIAPDVPTSEYNDGDSGDSGINYNPLFQRQWVDATSRCFTMPFNSTHRFWQLSFPSSFSRAETDTEKRNEIIRTTPPEDLKSMALHVCDGWTPDIIDLIKRTPLSTLSGHPVYDRAPLDVSNTTSYGNHNNNSTENYDYRSCITLIGDAVHPMSPMKGQGANQALLDAVQLARFLAGTTIAPLRCQRRSGYQSITKCNSKSEGNSNNRKAIQMKINDGLVQVGDEWKGVNKSQEQDLQIYNSRGRGVRKGTRSIRQALDEFELDMAKRSSVKVIHSHNAAALLHSTAALSKGNITRAAAATATAIVTATGSD